MVRKTSSWLFMLHRRNRVHIIISNMICHVRLNQIFPDTTKSRHLLVPSDYENSRFLKILA